MSRPELVRQIFAKFKRPTMLCRRPMASDRQQPTETDTLLVKHVAVGKPCTHHDRQLPKDGSAVKASQEHSREQPPTGGQHEAVQP
jgi:hypothetical protein